MPRLATLARRSGGLSHARAPLAVARSPFALADTAPGSAPTHESSARSHDFPHTSPSCAVHTHCPASCHQRRCNPVRVERRTRLSRAGARRCAQCERSEHESSPRRDSCPPSGGLFVGSSLCSLRLCRVVHGCAGRVLGGAAPQLAKGSGAGARKTPVPYPVTRYAAGKRRCASYARVVHTSVHERVLAWNTRCARARNSQTPACGPGLRFSHWFQWGAQSVACAGRTDCLTGLWTAQGGSRC